jgi:hypothetical protein
VSDKKDFLEKNWKVGNLNVGKDHSYFGTFGQLEKIC